MAEKPEKSGKGERSKPRAIDMVMEEMQREQQQRDKARREGRPVVESDYRDRDGPGGSSHDASDPYSTNLYVGNLAPDVDEEVLKLEFAKYGPVASVKIMWPRGEEADTRRSKGRNCGFVAFMTRSSAEKAKEEMDGRILHGLDLRIGWGKSIPLPSTPLWPPANNSDHQQNVISGKRSTR